MQNKRDKVVRTLILSTWAAAAGYWLRRKKTRREDLARLGVAATQQAVASLDVPAQSVYLVLEEVRLHAVVAGPKDAPLVVLLHGFPECWYSWRHQITALVRAGYRIVAPDQRGYNLSAKPQDVQAYRLDRLATDVQELVHALDRERAIIVGHDWGGVVAWRLAIDYPALVEKLVVLNAPHPAAYVREIRHSWTQRARSWYALCFQIPWLPETLLGLDPEATAQLFFRGTAKRAGAFSKTDLRVMAIALAQSGALRTMIHWYRAAAPRPLSHDASKAALRNILREVSRDVSTIEASTLLIWGEDDLALDKRLTYGLEKWVPDLMLHYVPACGHWVQNEAPGEVNQQMLAFLNRVIG